MQTIQQADERLRQAEAAFNEIAARREAVRAALNGESAAENEKEPRTMAERLARAQERLDPESANKRLRSELDILDGMMADQLAVLNRARDERDNLVRFLSTGEYVRKLRAYADAAQAARDAYFAVEQEAGNVTSKMLGGVILPRVRNPNEALLAIIAQAEHAIARCQSTTGMDDRKTNPLLDLLNPFSKMRAGPPAPSAFDLPAVARGKPLGRFFR